MTTFEDAKVGDKVWDLFYNRWCTIRAIVEDDKFPILVWEEDNDLHAIETRGEYASSYLEMCKPLTNDEIDEKKKKKKKT